MIICAADTLDYNDNNRISLLANDTIYIVIATDQMEPGHPRACSLFGVRRLFRHPSGLLAMTAWGTLGTVISALMAHLTANEVHPTYLYTFIHRLSTWISIWL
jgi:hypothetical protein